MRIGTYNSMLSQIYGQNQTKKSTSTNSTGYTSFVDQVSFSSAGKDMQIAKNALAGVSDVRQSKVDAVRSQIANGTYNVDSDSFAEKLLGAFAAQSQ